MTKRNGESVPDGHGNYHWFFRGQCGEIGIIPESELQDAIQELALRLDIEDDSDPLVIFNGYHPVITWRLAHAFTGIEMTNWKSRGQSRVQRDGDPAGTGDCSGRPANARR